MPHVPNIEETIGRVVHSTMKGRKLSRVLVEPATDSYGDEALSITVVVNDAGNVTGDNALDTILKISQELQKAGEHRLAITSFATEAELSSNGDTEL